MSNSSARPGHRYANLRNSLGRLSRLWVVPFAAVAVAGHLEAQDTATLDDTQTAWLESRLASLDTDYTDWILLRDICDKAVPLGAAAIPVLDEVLAEARERDDPRWSLRILGVLARIDDRGVQQLRDLTEDEHSGTAAIAARVLGRCGSQTEAARQAFAEALQAEERPGVASAIAMGAADAGAAEAAPAIATRLESGDLPPQFVRWFAIALARLSHDTPAAKVATWLKSSTRMADAGVLAARWHRDPELEPLPMETLLLERFRTSEGVVRTWVIHSLGACGGEAAREALRDSLDADDAERKGPPGVTLIQSTEVDPRLLALARLGEPAAQEWLASEVATDGRREDGTPTSALMSPETVRLAELYGKWRCPKSTETLRTRLDTSEGFAWSRAHAARGLCWQRDTKGLEGAAELLVNPQLHQMERGFGSGLELAQATLHEFVANPDRPDYVLVGHDEAVAARIGKEWQDWLERRRDAIEWRDPMPDDDMVLWR